MDLETICINKARDFVNKNQNIDIFTYLANNNDYQQLDKHNKKHYLKTINKFFGNVVKLEDLIMYEELIN